MLFVCEKECDICISESAIQTEAVCAQGDQIFNMRLYLGKLATEGKAKYGTRSGSCHICNEDGHHS